MASTFVQSLRRLYNATPQKVTKEQVAERVATGKITEENYEYITGEKYGK